MPLAFVGVVVMAAFSGPAHAQVATRDSVVGHGTADPSVYYRFDITTASGPSGENPTGEVFLALFNGKIFASGPVTCLAVTGQRAVIGFRDEGEHQVGQVIVEVEDLGGPGSGLDTISSSAGTGRDPGDCSPLTDGLFAHVDSGDIVVTDAQPRRRMVGKGSVPSLSTVGPTASYAYILNCDPTPNAPFQVRFGTQRFRLTTVISSSCTNLNGPIHEGTGSGTLTSGGPGVIQWAFADGGAGGMSDFATITIRNAAGTTVFQGGAAPPGKFPGSTQTTGNNTFQNIP